MKHERRMMQRVLCGLVLFGCLGLLWTTRPFGTMVQAAVSSDVRDATSQETLPAAKGATVRGEYKASETGTPEDKMITKDRKAAEVIRAYSETEQPLGKGRVTWVPPAVDVATGVQVKFTGRAAGWGANYTVEGEKKPPAGPGTADTKPWYSYFAPKDEPRILLEINGDAAGDNTVMMGANPGALKLELVNGDSTKTYTLTLSCTGRDGENGMVTFGTVPGLTTVSPTGTVDLTGTAIGKMTLSGTCADAEVIPVNGEVVEFAVEEVTFLDEVERVKKDSDGTVYSLPHWKRDRSGGVDGYPACYMRMDTMKTEAILETTGTPSGEYQIKGETAGFSLTHQGNATVSGKTIKATVTADNAFEAGDGIRCFDSMTIVWSYRHCPSGGSWSEWKPAGESANQVYVTLGTPVGTLHHTVLHIGCENAKTRTTEDSTLASIWTEFRDRYVTRVDGELMTYYANYNTRNVDTGALLANKDGQCGAWAHLLIDTLKAQGIQQSDNWFTVFPSQAGTQDKGFLVKNWAFSPAGRTSSPSVFPYTNTQWGGKLSTSYVWVSSEVTDSYGIPGQGNSNPASLFNCHFVVAYFFTHGGALLLDPSYGTSYSSVANIEATALSGYYHHVANVFWTTTYIGDTRTDDLGNQSRSE